MSWISRQIRERERERWNNFLRPKSTKPKLKVPSDAPCNSCVQKIGSGICKSRCDYWIKLQKLAKDGVLDAVKSADVSTNTPSGGV